MTVTAAMVKELREKTGAGILDAKKLKILSKKKLLLSVKKSQLEDLKLLKATLLHTFTTAKLVYC